MDLSQEQENLAMEIAGQLDDMDSLTMHRRYVKEYSREFLLDMLDMVMKVPKRKIRASRAAYYVFLVTQNAKSSAYQYKYHSRD